MEELKRRGYHSLDEVFYAVIGTMWMRIGMS
jgi:hypothetical protein